MKAPAVSAAYGLALVLVRVSNGFQQPQHILSNDWAGSAPVATADLEQFISRTIEDFHTPGLAVAVIDGPSTWMKGFGHARSNSTTTVGPYTLFFTGSTTKSFTAAAMSQIVEDSVQFPHVHWDTPISSLIRDDFVLSDPWATEHITIVDALSHRTGYPAHDAAAWADAHAATRALRNLPMSAEPRVKYQYSNQLVTAVGYLIQKLYYPSSNFAGALGYVFQSKLWRPMGMVLTYLSTQIPGLIDPYGALADEMWWHNDSGSYVVVPHAVHAGHEAAGMVISCVADYVKWLKSMMSDDKGPVSVTGKAAMKAPRTIMAGKDPRFTGPLYYGMGWASGVFEGQEFWFHNGQMREHRTEMWIFPQKQFGVVIMANANNPAIEVVLWRILYDHFGVPQKRRFDVEKRARDAAQADERSLETCLDRLYPRSLPALPRPLLLTAYAGTYENLGYGNITISLQCGDNVRKNYPIDSPAHPTVERGCSLRGIGSLEFEGKEFHVDFEHVTGDHWVAWLFVNDYAPPDAGLAMRPQLCLRAQFRVGPDNTVGAVGADFRWEGENGPLVWYDRRKSAD